MVPVRILTVCTHNRTRSVLMGGLLELHFARLDTPGVVRTAGFRDPDQPPTAETVDALARRGRDVRHHRSSRVDELLVGGADLVVTAERIHVVEIAGRWPDAFAKTLTLPEVVTATQLRPLDDPSAPADLRTWLDELAAERPHQLDYLDNELIGEIPDPTGQPPAAWSECINLIDDLTERLAGFLHATADAIEAR